MPDSANRSTCFVIDTDPGTRHVVRSVWGGMSVAAEFFETVPAMLERYAAVRPDLIMIDVTADSGTARRHLEMLVAAGVDRPVRIMSGLNGLLCARPSSRSRIAMAPRPSPKAWRPRAN